MVLFNYFLLDTLFDTKTQFKSDIFLFFLKSGEKENVQISCSELLVRYIANYQSQLCF